MILFLSASVVTAGDKGIITIIVENKALQPRIVQVRDLVAHSKPSWICEEAKRTIEKCRILEATTNKKKTNYKISESDCAKAEVTLETKKCLYPDLIFDQKLNASEKVELQIRTNFIGYGEIAVRSEDNTLDWTMKSNLKDGDIVGHQ